jgi:predicted signal transduction protein with EAL and GGDEF domain
VRRFVPQIQEEHSERRFFLRELEAAIAKDVFEVHYQPVVAAEGGSIVGVEALLRWTHPTRGAIPPSMFIPHAEESGLMVELGEIALRRALSDGTRWPELFALGAVLAETGMPASRVVLEVTEGVLIDNPEETQVKLEALRAIGVSDRARRFRHRLFELELSAEVSVRPAQDRSQLHRFARHHRQFRRYRAVESPSTMRSA